MVGAVKGVDPETGFNYDDTKRYIDAATGLSKEAKEKIFHGNVRKVYPRFAAQRGSISSRGPASSRPHREK
jgi:4-oxalmesaconate hydratase